MPIKKLSNNQVKRVRVAIVWTQLSGYLNACLSELAADERVDLFVSNESASKDAPYKLNLFSWIKERYQWTASPDKVELLKRLEVFSPDIILCSGWNINAHRYVLRKFKNKAIRLIALDNPWRGTVKQFVGTLISKFYLHPICDALFVAGERQAVFAKKLGFTQSEILRGVLSCDHDQFSEIYLARQNLLAEPKCFVFIGRLSHEKGLDILVEAYLRYRGRVDDPWPLRCYGVGPMAKFLDKVEGVELKGFFQPDDLSKELLGVSCLILPSKFEPWALVVHEAAAAGLAIISSEAVGASVHLFLKGHNGDIVETSSICELADAMASYSLMSDMERKLMGQNSYQLSLQFTPRRWANTLTNYVLHAK